MCDWSSMFTTSSVEDSWLSFKGLFLWVINSVAPIKQIRLKQRSDQTEPATFSFLSCWATCGFPILSLLVAQQRCLCRVAAVKSLPVHSIRAVIFSISQIVQHDIDVVFDVHFSFSTSPFRLGWFQYSRLYSWVLFNHPWGYGVCFFVLCVVFWQFYLWYAGSIT